MSHQERFGRIRRTRRRPGRGLRSGRAGRARGPAYRPQRYLWVIPAALIGLLLVVLAAAVR
ncbi:MAG: hypothetical protein ACRCYU_02235 [Nocardioides sp.]